MDVRKVGDLSSPKLSLPNKTDGTDGFKRIYQEKLSAVSQMTQATAVHVDTDLIDQGDRVLDLLDSYANELNNPEKNLRDIDPLVKAIENEINVFEAKRAEHAGMDEAMEGLAEELAVIANVAMLKFQRGDYI